ncbi:MAG: PVC-type heme-binding CxxCH protein [Fuerstiella sp.]
MIHIVRLLPMLILLLIASQAWSQPPSSEPDVPAEAMPRLAPTEPNKALGTFEVADGFQLSLAAHEPDVMDPIAMCFDHRGRAYVVEMRGYSERRDQALGRIRLLTDTNGDGQFDQSTVFKDGLNWPTAVVCYKGGVFVGATPNLYYFRDTDGDDVCDEEKVVFTGFASGQARLNVQAMFNSFRWGPDNRIWAATSAMSGTVSRPDDPTFQPLNLRGADFSFDPELLDLRPENGQGQNGMTFGPDGRRYCCRNSQHAIWVAYERHQVRPNPLVSIPSALTDIPADGNQCPVYRLSPDEPWRIARTKLRLAGLVKGTAEAGGRVSGFLTAATGVHSFWSSGLGQDDYGSLFVADVGSNLIHRMQVEFHKGQVAPVAVRPDEDDESEFIRSRDNWFRPVSFATGPDGALYVVDMYREVIEHPWSLPDNIKKHLDLNSGMDRGRIYRVAAESAKPETTRTFKDLTKAELQAWAKSSSDWHQTTARRLLYELGHPEEPKPPVSPFPALLSSASVLLDEISAAESDPWIRAAVLNSIRTLADAKRAWQKAYDLPLGSLHSELALLCGKMNDGELVDHIVDRLVDLEMSGPLVEVIRQLGAGLTASDGDWQTVTQSSKWDKLLTASKTILDDPTAARSKKVAAIQIRQQLVRASTFTDLKDRFQQETDPEVLSALSDAIPDPSWLIQRYSKLPQAAKAKLSNRILAAPDAALLFLQTLQAQQIELQLVPAALIQGLRRHRDSRVAALAKSVLPTEVTRESVIAAYQSAINQPGDRQKGHAVFMKTCSTCHLSHEGQGKVLGPAITTFSKAGRESLLTNIFHPNKEVAAQYQAYQFVTDDGKVLAGIIKSETVTDVTLEMLGGITTTFPRKIVVEMKNQGVSLMPEGLEREISVEDMPHLLEYLLSPAN